MRFILINLFILISVNAQISMPVLENQYSAYSLAKADISYFKNNSLSFISLPSILNENGKKRVSFQISNWSDLTNTKSFNYSSSLFGLGFGIYGILSEVPDIEERTSPSLDPISKFNNSESLLTLSLSKKITEHFSFGLSYKQLFLNLYNYESAGFAFDFSLHYAKNEYFIYSIVKNIGEMGKLKEKPVDIQPSYIIGAAYNLIESAAIAFEYRENHLRNNTVHLAANYQISENFDLMTGYVLNEKSRDWSFGLSFDYNFITLVYGYANHKYYDFYQSFQLAFSF